MKTNGTENTKTNTVQGKSMCSVNVCYSFLLLATNSGTNDADPVSGWSIIQSTSSYSNVESSWPVAINWSWRWLEELWVWNRCSFDNRKRRKQNQEEEHNFGTFHFDKNPIVVFNSVFLQVPGI
jgi:hypothetical protein